MQIIEIRTSDQFFQELTLYPKVIADFYKDNCMPCKMLALSLTKLSQSEQTQNIVLFKIKLEIVGEDFFHRFQLRQTPSLIFFSNAQEIKRMTGFVSPEKILENVDLLSA